MRRFEAQAYSDAGIAVRVTTHRDLHLSSEDGRFWRSNGKQHDLAEVKSLHPRSLNAVDWRPLEQRTDSATILSIIED